MKRAAPAPSAQELWHAVARDDFPLVRYLLEQGADPNAVGLKPHPLVMCARRNELAMLQLLLDAKADPDGGGSSSDFVPLSVCETREAAAMVIAAGANLNQENAMGHTPLHVIAAKGDSVASIAVLQTIIDAGADVNRKLTCNTTPLSHCFLSPSKIAHLCAVYLLDHGAKVDSPHYLRWAVKIGLVQLAAALIRAGASADSFLSPSLSLLNHAIFHGTSYGVEMVQVLVAGGANVNEKLSEGTSLLDKAMLFAPQAIPCLLAAGAIVDRAALRSAVTVQSSDLSTILSYSTFRDNLLLHFAVENAKSFAAIVTLLEHGYDPDVRNRRGETLLWLYARKQNLGMMIELMRYGANPELAPNKRPPLLAFLLSDSKSMPHFVRPAVALLLRAGADPSPFRSVGTARIEELYPACECLDAESVSDLFLKEAFGKWLPPVARPTVKI